MDPMMKCIESNGSNDEPANGRNGSAGQQLLFNYTGLEGERWALADAVFHLFKTSQMCFNQSSYCQRTSWSPLELNIPPRLPLCDYPAEGRVREEPRVRRQENGFCQQIKFTDNSQKKVKFPPPLALLPIFLDLSALVYFPNNAKVIWLRTTNFMTQLTLNMTVTQITLGGKGKWWGKCKCWNPI